MRSLKALLGSGAAGPKHQIAPQDERPGRGQVIPNVVPGKGAVVSSSCGFLWPTARRMALMRELFPAFCAPTCMHRQHISFELQHRLRPPTGRKSQTDLY